MGPYKQHGQSLRPGRLPSLRPRNSHIDYSLTGQDEAVVHLNDTEADKFGPLTEAALKAERDKSRLDPRHLRRPLRLLPIGQIEKDTAEFKAFRKQALENDFMIKLIDNPKQPGKASWERYNQYQLASTLRELIELSSTSGNPAERQM